MKYTPWFCIKTTCPDKPGVYELKRDGTVFVGLRYSKWTGKTWFGVHSQIADAMKADEPSEIIPNGALSHWRGLTTKDGK